MRVVGASATHVGQVREANQDRALVSGSLGAVADGMGGHLGGEHAAALAIAELSGVRGYIDEHRLIEVVEAANLRIHEGSVEPQYRGMGTTVVAATFDASRNVITIVNVGDSRGYLFRQQQLSQITVDHSLVEDLLRQGRLTEEEARVHPQRNIVTRALGIGPEVEVDAFAVEVAPGDRIVLASDGLFNEVEDDGIAAILARLAEPTEAVDELVRVAVERGGRDNVTVVILDLVEGDDPAAAQDAADDAAPVGRPIANDKFASDNGGPSGGTLGPDPAVADPDKSSFWRRFRPRSMLLTLGVLSVVVLGFGGTAVYARSGYFADERDGDVVILRGRPSGMLWFKPSIESETSLTVDELDGASRERLAQRPVWPTLEDAMDFVDNLETPAEPDTPEPSD